MNEHWEFAPTLAGHAVRLRPLEAEDALSIVQAIDDPAIFEFSNDAYPDFVTELVAGEPISEDDGAEMVQNYLSRESSSQHWPMLISTLEGWGLGLTSFYERNPENRSVAIGYTWISKGAWGTAANAETKLLMLQHAFEVLECKRVTLYVDNRNLRSQAAVSKLGAVREGVRRNDRMRRDGTWRDTVSFSIIDEEWPQVKANLQNRIAEFTR